MVEYKRLDSLKEIYDIVIKFDVCFPHLKEKISDLKSYVEKLYNHANVYIQMSGNTVSGLVVFYSNDEVQKIGYITLIGTLPEFRRQKLGKQLLDFCEKVMLQSGMRTIRLEVDNDNTGAIEFYGKAGFTKEGDASVTSFYMKKRLERSI